MSDLDWRWWAHWGKTEPEQRQCAVHNRLSFLTRSGSGSGGLDTLRIECGACGASRPLSGITSPETLDRMKVRCTGRQPWQSSRNAEECNEIPRALQRGASNLYFPLVHSSIEIPQPSAAETESDEALRVRNSIWFAPLLKTDQQHPAYQSFVQSLAADAAVNESLVTAVLREERRRAEGQETVVTAGADDLLAGEWAAFITLGRTSIRGATSSPATYPSSPAPMPDVRTSPISTTGSPRS